ncbi:hypothetical protein EB796_014015 [Bugula neritina]|uniref:Craniofacial development protein 2-like n=1 Tax=Bugula neritina TaxID=10212 RepID=A0A7J7JPR4_BUGNE|nr:hypothetical protein EB796_014015 [Bugula neritina]
MKPKQIVSLVTYDTSSTPPVALSTVSVYTTRYIRCQNTFYENLATMIRNILDTEQLFLLGNFNARVGAALTEYKRSPS